MKKSTKTIGGSFLLAALGFVTVIAWPDGDIQPTDTPLGPEVVALLPDGGLTYIVAVLLEDGGQTVRFTTPKCVRRWPGTPENECRRLMQGMQGMIEVDPGDLNRFPMSEAVGTGCQPVACSVIAGDDSDLPEIDIAQNYPLEIPENSSM